MTRPAPKKKQITALSYDPKTGKINGEDIGDGKLRPYNPAPKGQKDCMCEKCLKQFDLCNHVIDDLLELARIKALFPLLVDALERLHLDPSVKCTALAVGSCKICDLLRECKGETK